MSDCNIKIYRISRFYNHVNLTLEQENKDTKKVINLLRLWRCKRKDIITARKTRKVFSLGDNNFSFSTLCKTRDNSQLCDIQQGIREESFTFSSWNNEVTFCSPGNNITLLLIFLEVLCSGVDNIFTQKEENEYTDKSMNFPIHLFFEKHVYFYWFERRTCI